LEHRAVAPAQSIDLGVDTTCVRSCSADGPRHHEVLIGIGVADDGRTQRIGGVISALGAPRDLIADAGSLSRRSKKSLRSDAITQAWPLTASIPSARTNRRRASSGTAASVNSSSNWSTTIAMRASAIGVSLAASPALARPCSTANVAWPGSRLRWSASRAGS